MREPIIDEGVVAVLRPNLMSLFTISPDESLVSVWVSDRVTMTPLTGTQWPGEMVHSVGLATAA